MSTRTFHVSRAEAGLPVAVLLRRRLGIPGARASELVRAGAVRVGTVVCRQAGRQVRAGQRVEVQAASRGPAERSRAPDKPPVSLTPPKKPARRPKKLRPQHGSSDRSASSGAARETGGLSGAALRSAGPRLAIVYADRDLVVVDKPAGLTTMRHAHEAAEFGERGRRFLPPTLADLLPAELAAQGHGPGRVIAVHRLDRDTSGLVIFARNPEAARNLGAQFREHTTQRTYLALVRGRAQPGRIESHLVPDRGDGRRGSGPRPGEGQRAVTHVRVVEDLGDFTLVECRLETGRTHQVRIHLGERGTPLCGERIYDRPLHGQPLPDTSGAARLCLHAASLGAEHPTTGKRLTWESPLPHDMDKLVRRLRKRLPPRRTLP
jgi:23S rRNA pseudouridine1911/1915/1917 synthase